MLKCAENNRQRERVGGWAGGRNAGRERVEEEEEEGERARAEKVEFATERERERSKRGARYGSIYHARARKAYREKEGE